MNKKKVRRVLKFLNFYPPLLAAGIRIRETNEELTRVRVEMALRWYNRNLFGTHFGGSLYAMCDPFYVFIILSNIGENYIVWDKTASIKFIKPGKGKVSATFEVSQDQLNNIVSDLEEKGKHTYQFSTQVLDESGGTVAEVHKEVYVRKK